MAKSIVREDDRGGLTKRIRAEVALRNLPSSMPSVLAAPGDVIDVQTEDGFLRGHGTQVVEGRLLATIPGVVERVNKLVTVRPVKSRYVAECGDVLVGRVVEISGKRWKLDINSRQAATLLLSAVNLPGGIQRRRTNVDELNMRAMFEECDLISAEVQQVMSDGMVSLHTRSLKYGKLSGGHLEVVPSALVRRQKQHFHTLEDLGVDVLFGCNGLVWLGVHPADQATSQDPNAELDVGHIPDVEVDAVTRERICRLSAGVRVLAALFLPMDVTVLRALYDTSLQLGVEPRDMRALEFQTRVLEMEAERRTAELA